MQALHEREEWMPTECRPTLLLGALKQMEDRWVLGSVKSNQSQSNRFTGWLLECGSTQSLVSFLRPARPFVVSKSFQQPNQKMPILLYTNREHRMFYKEPSSWKKKGQTVWVLVGPKRYKHCTRGDTNNELLKQQQRTTGFDFGGPKRY